MRRMVLKYVRIYACTRVRCKRTRTQTCLRLGRHNWVVVNQILCVYDDHHDRQLTERNLELKCMDAMAFTHTHTRRTALACAEKCV